MRRVVPVLVALSLATASCGVGTERSPNRVDPSLVPFNLLAGATTTTTAPARANVRIVIYWEGTQRLVPVTREVAPPAGPRAALGSLENGPTSTESNEGLTSPASSAGPYTLRDVQSGVASVDVSDAYTALAGQNQIIATAQLVFTLTGLPGITGVVLLVGGQPTQVPSADGSLVEGPLTRADYLPLAPV